MVIQSTVLTNSLSVLQQHVSVVVLAGLDGCTVGWGVSASIVGLGCASSGTLGDVEGSLLKDADAEVGILAAAVEGCVDGGVTKVDGIGVTGGCDDLIRDVAV